MLSIDAGPISSLACKLQPYNTRSSNAMYCASMALVGLSAFAGLFMFMFWLFSTDPWHWQMWAHGGVLLGLFLSEGVHRIGMNKTINGTYSRIVTERYKDLLPHNKELAAPLVRTVYKLEPLENSFSAIRERVALLDKIAERDRKDRARQIETIDNSDMDMVKAVLEGYKKLEA